MDAKRAFIIFVIGWTIGMVVGGLIVTGVVLSAEHESAELKYWKHRTSCLHDDGIADHSWDARADGVCYQADDPIQSHRVRGAIAGTGYASPDGLWDYSEGDKNGR